MCTRGTWVIFRGGGRDGLRSASPHGGRVRPLARPPRGRGGSLLKQLGGPAPATLRFGVPPSHVPFPSTRQAASTPRGSLHPDSRCGPGGVLGSGGSLHGHPCPLRSIPCGLGKVRGSEYRPVFRYSLLREWPLSLSGRPDHTLKMKRGGRGAISISVILFYAC